MFKMKQILPMMLMLFAASTTGVEAQNKSGLDLTNLDKTVRPADDFYQFATGGWQKLHPLPAAYSRYGSFDMLAENVNKQVNSILTSLEKKQYKEGTTSASSAISISWQWTSSAATGRGWLP